MENDLSEKIGSLLSDPVMLEKIKGIAAGLGGMQESPAPAPPPDTQKSETVPAAALGALFPAERGGALGGIGRNIKESRALLSALKPYLDSERCERIDKIISIMRVAEIMGYLG